MAKPQGRGPKAVEQAETDPTVEQFWSTLSMGCLFVAAGALSPAVYALHGEWPAGYGGVVAAAFATVGIGLLGYSAAVKS